MASNNITDVDRIGLQWLLATGLAASALLVTELPIWVTLIYGGTVLWRYVIERWQRYRPGRLVRYVLLALAVSGIYLEFGSIFGRDPGVALLLVLLGLKLFELRNRRDAMLTLFLLYVLLGGAFLFDQTLPVALWALVVVTMSLMTLIRLQQPVTWRVTWRLGAEILLKAVPLLVLLYVLFPRMGGTLWGMPNDAYSGRTGISDEMRPGSIRSVSESSEVALRVDFLGATPPAARDQYWRGLVLWGYDGLTWRRNVPATGSEPLQALSPPLQYQVTLEPSHRHWLFALDLPVAVSERVQPRPGYTLWRAAPVSERITYVVTSHTRYTTGPLTTPERSAALALPDISPRVREFADRLRAQHADPVARAQEVLNYFRNEEFFYTLTPPLLGGDPVDEFLFETRRGFCEHYAGAYAVLMRAAGIPARVVVGYQGGELNPTGNYLIVRQYDAHAWTELWFPERGWVRIDPTAAVAPERVELGFDAVRRLAEQGLRFGGLAPDLLAQALQRPWFEKMVRNARLYWDYTNLAWYRWVVDYRQPRQESLLRKLGFQHIDWTHILLTLGSGCLLVLLSYIAWARRGPVPDPAQRLYLRFCRKLSRAGVTRAPYEGPRDFAGRAGGRRPELAPTIHAITERYLNLRYGRRAGNDEMRELARTVAAFKARRQPRRNK
jgi:transglutaminase-like putative cysteine protease